MAYQDDFERRRRERRRRARRRKKRIRAAILLVALIAVIVLIVLAVNAISGDKSEPVSGGETDVIEATAAPDSSAAPAEPTPLPANTASLNIPPASEENDLIQIIADANQTKRCYLTFDDGPTENITPQILDILRRYNIKGTFFEVGSMIEANPDMARRVYEEGHLIANHSSGHNYDKVYASTDAFITEVNDCFNIIKGVMDGEEPFPLFRFPGGSYNAGDHAEIKQDCKQVLAQNGIYYCDWNCLNGDAEGRAKNGQELYEYFVNTSEGYNNLIVLMHDAATKQETVNGLPLMIDYLIEQGYTFHRLDEIDYQPVTVNTSANGESEDSYGDSEDNSSSYDNDSDSYGNSENNSSSYEGDGNSSSASNRSNNSLGTTTRTSVNGTSTVTTNSSSKN